MKIRNRKHLYMTSTILRGRRLREGEEAGGGTGGDSGQGGDNAGVNSGDGTGDSANPDNALPAGGADAFWKDPADPNASANNDDGDDSDFGAGIVTEINSFKAPELFTADIAKEISEGNLEGVNKAFQTAMTAAVQRSVVLAAKIMQQFEQSIDGRINSHIGSSRTEQKDEKLLTDSFPSFANPAMRTTIQGVFQQSLKHTAGDRTKALAMTRGMLKQMGQLGQKDFGIESAPAGPDDFQGEGPSSLVRDLLAMNN